MSKYIIVSLFLLVSCSSKFNYYGGGTINKAKTLVLRMLSNKNDISDICDSINRVNIKYKILQHDKISDQQVELLKSMSDLYQNTNTELEFKIKVSSYCSPIDYYFTFGKNFEFFLYCSIVDKQFVFVFQEYSGLLFFYSVGDLAEKQNDFYRDFEGLEYEE